jgi:NADH-quinone oxidoreductase subunit J
MNAVLIALALLTLGTAALALSGRNLLRSVLLLTVSWTGVAGFFLWAGAEFAAFAQVLVYVGAISMVVLFAVLLTRRTRDEGAAGPGARSRAVSGILVGAAVALVLLVAVAGAAFPPGPASAPGLTVRDLGLALMGPQAAALLVLGALLTVALVGAVVLAAGDRPGDRKDGP